MVEEDQPIADMMTDKATVEMAAPVSGRDHRDWRARWAIRSRSARRWCAVRDRGRKVKPPRRRPHRRWVTAPRRRPRRRPWMRRWSSRHGRRRSPLACRRDRGRVLRLRNPCLDFAQHPWGRAPVLERGGEKTGRCSRHRRCGSGPRILVSICPSHAAWQWRARSSHSRSGRVPALFRAAAKARQPVRAPIASYRGHASTRSRSSGLRRRIAENMAESKRRIPHFAYVEETRRHRAGGVCARR